MKNNNYDALIIGGGHNGLVTAAYLAKAGKKVLVLERRDTLGGAAATEEIWPGFKINTGASDAGMLRPEVVAELGLRRHGLEFIESQVTAFAPQPNGPALTLWRDPRETRAEIARFSPADAEKFPAFMRLVTALTSILDNIMTLTPPSLEEAKPGDLFPWAKLGLKLKGLGQREMMEFLRVLPMTAQEFLDEWFESEALKGLLGAAGISGTMQGPQSSGTAFVLLYHYLGAADGGFKATRLVRGGTGQLVAALASAARQYGAELRTGAEVSRILLAENPNTGETQAVGVVLAGGEEILAKAVISNADPRRTLFGLVGAPNLEPHLIRRVRNIRYRGCVAKVNLALNGLPEFTSLPEGDAAENNAYLGGHIVISPTLEYLERAYDDAKYGRFSAQPYLDVIIPSVLDPSLAPAGQHVMSITMQYAPYKLQGREQGSGWDERQKQALVDKIVDTLAHYAPNLKDLIRHCQILTPLDWEQEYGLTEGSIFHGEMGLDQLLFMRPVPGYGQYRTPVGRLYLCGAGTHPGGGVTGAPGYNAAREILSDLKR
ncbi:MAG: NAD(P)/FAD-dependent oxidoreductase [Anaerolineales bacterium]|nr:NAD(P)/FAD-dependent oxidoreductase [Anaerolineales bacterium]